jgi:hypothetical protein
MTRRVIAIGVLGLLAITGVAAADETFRARLTGDQEVPPVVTDTTGSFTAHLTGAGHRRSTRCASTAGCA